MDSDLRHQQLHHHFQGLQQMETGCGLTRYRSAPSSYFSTFMDTTTTIGPANFSPPRPLSPETETILARFVQSVAGDAGVESAVGGTDSASSHKLCDIPENSMGFTATVKQEAEQFPELSPNSNWNTGCNSPSSSHPGIYQTSKKPPLARRSSNSMAGLSCGMESNFRVSSIGRGFSPSQIKMKSDLAGGGNSSGLTRHNSSPAGLFDNIIIENGYLVSGAPGTENYASSNKTNNNEGFSSQVGGLNDEMNFSSGQGQPTSSTGMLTAISDARNVGLTGEGNFITSFPVDTWNDSSMLSDQFPGLEGGVSELKLSENLNIQNGEGKNRPPGLLAHHLSLPKASLEKLLQLNDSVPCQIRAKRGCATHPRSIAERVRRTKISERMRKLQHVVPNMDKQTNTAEMLDLAVDYIKDLQNQVRTLANRQARCTCST